MNLGLNLFVKYALPPNVLGYCGPSTPLRTSPTEVFFDRQALFQFEGAVPYLRLIALANGIKDEFDQRVVEAYWLGNDLLKKVSDKNLYSNIEGRFKKKMKDKDWRWLVSESVPMAKPHHVFHVFDIYRRAGLLRSGAKDKILETMDNCRIGWGRVLRQGAGRVDAECNPLEFKDGKLILAKKTIKNLISLDPSIRVGDEVSIHWNYVCDRITVRQKRNLIFWTNFHLDITNKTL